MTMYSYRALLRRRRGFTLVELMITVAIIGILAALAIYGLEAYLANAKTAEAKRHVGSISRAAHASYERVVAISESLGESTSGSVEDHQLCDDAIAVPGTPPQGTKYQPDTADGADFNFGTPTSGWVCLKFDVSQPIHYQYHYNLNGPVVATNNPSACGTDCYEAAAAGDLNGDGVVQSYISRTGRINPTTKALKASSLLYVFLEDE